MNPVAILKVLGIGIIIVIVVFVLSLFELYTQLGRYNSYWQKNNKKPAMPNEILYIALGDSSAQGIGATSPQKGYVGLVAKELESRQNRPVRVINLSKSGAKVDDVINSQLPELEKLNPTDKTIVTMEIGANNIVKFDRAEFEIQMDEVMSKLPKQTIISDIPYFGQSRFKNKQPNVEMANQIMYKLAKKHDFVLAPLHERMQKNGGIKTFAADWFHPSNIAYRENWAHVFIDRINFDLN